MIEVHPRLYVGALEDCRAAGGGWAVIHACKTPCHQAAVGYKGSLPKDDPSYLVLRRGDELFLNIIDPPVPLFQMQSFGAFMAFVSEQLQKDVDLLIHCNQGLSRAPSLALLAMAFRLRALPDGSYSAAREAFQIIHPGYSPGAGIARFLTDNWEAVRRL